MKLTMQKNQIKNKCINLPCGEYGIYIKMTIDLYYKIQNNNMSIKFNDIKDDVDEIMIYKWKSDAPIGDSHGRYGIISHHGGRAYVPWLHYTRQPEGKFELMPGHVNNIYYAFPPVHIWLKDINDLINWFGEDAYKSIFTLIMLDKFNKI